MMPEEMILLRNALDARKIAWYNATDNLDRSFPFMNLIIYRTKYEHGGSRWSVISGYGTFGGQDGLLELMIDNKEPIGNLTAEEVLRMMDEFSEMG